MNTSDAGPRAAVAAAASAVAGVLVLVVASAPSVAAADAYRLRGDALVQARAPTGVLVLDGHGEVTPELGVEVYLWGGVGGDPSAEADLLVAALSYIDADGRGELRAGRILITSGALRPLHMDGLSALVRAPSGTSLSLFGGLPTTPRFEGRSWDWAVGGRLAQDLGPLTAGIAYLQQRDAGQLAFHELGLDAVLFPADWLDFAARGAFDLIATTPTLAELVVTAAFTTGPVRTTLSGVHRSPAHLLPATSLFSVLGDRATRTLDLRAEWQAAPRLVVSGGGGARFFDDVAYEDLAVRAQLRLAREATGGALGLELRRQGAPDGGWWGARLFTRVPIIEVLAASAELELLRPDQQDRGEVWPWGLVALSWRPHPSWEVAAAFEASVSPEALRAFDGLLRATYLWSEP